MEGQEPADEGPARYPAYLVRRVRLHNLRSHPLDDLDDLHLSPLSNDSQEEQEERGEQEGAVIVLPANGAQKILHAHTNGLVDEVIDTACNLENGIEPAEIEHPRDDPGGLSSKFAEAAAAAEASPQDSNGTINDTFKEPVQELSSFLEVSGGSPRRQNSWAVKDCLPSSGKVATWVWGRGDFGQLGRGNTSNLSKPQLLDILSLKDVVLVTGNLYNTAFLLADGDLMICGNNDNAQLGWDPQASMIPEHLLSNTNIDSDALSITVPARVASLDAFSVHHAAAGLTHMCAVVADGLLTSWGGNDWGQLGQGSAGAEVGHPKLIKRVGTQSTVRVAAGESHTLTLSSSGVVSSFGLNTFGQLGRPGTAEERANMVEMKSLWHLGVVQIACGDNHCLVLTVRGLVLSFGRGKYGQLGLGDFENKGFPQVVRLPLPVVQVACGGDHSLALGERGEVFSWGRGTWGQTGHNSMTNTNQPLQIQALIQEHIVQVSGGSRHSLALSRCGTLFGFGSGEQGQLGLGDLEDRLVPTQLPTLSRGLPLFVVATGMHSVAVCRAMPTRDFQMAGPQEIYGCGLTALLLPDFSALAGAAQKERRELVTLKHAATDIFTNSGYLVALVASCRLQKDVSCFDVLDHGKIAQLYANVLQVEDDEVASAVAGAACVLIDKMHLARLAFHNERGLESHERRKQTLQVLYILLQNPLNDGRLGKKLMKKLVHAVLEQGVDIIDLQSWIKILPTAKFRDLLLRPLQRYLSFVAAHQHNTAPREEMIDALRVLELLHIINKQERHALPAAEFYNLEVSYTLDLHREYMTWRQWEQRRKERPDLSQKIVSVCQLPFCINPEGKAKILKLESDIQKIEYSQAARELEIRLGARPGLLQSLHIVVRRESLLSDALRQILKPPAGDLKKQLMVHFESNGVMEEGVDGGGVTKEFFQLLVKDLFKEKFGMFVLDTETRNFWFNLNSIESEKEFHLVGRLIGVAVHNSVILDVRFPSILYKKLCPQLYKPLGFEDLKEAFPDVGNGLQRLLEEEGDVESIYSHNFEVEYDHFGELRKVPLKPGGSQIPVTNDNRAEFVELYTKFKLYDSVKSNFDAFANGFVEVCGGPALSLFRTGEELELLISGVPQLDFEDLQTVASYQGDYNQEHATVKALWFTLHAFSLDEKKQFLKFTTGCDRAPVGGLGNLKLVIQRAGPDTESLPTSHTCFNYLLLPDYSSEEKLRQKLKLAISYAEGFGLQ